ncbi:hypothetical protein [Silicimonas sp. MF1-12-2]|uniref:hypothetical protein n=1 Tax=Silicimonas sp. MF1-12-2 TaxID=3384793 RepID=UPI0039B5E0F5
MDKQSGTSEIVDTIKELGKDTALGLFRLVGVVLASGIAGTVIGAGFCLWYGAPIGLALVGGLLGIVLALVVLYAVYDAW